MLYMNTVIDLHSYWENNDNHLEHPDKTCMNSFLSFIIGDAVDHS